MELLQNDILEMVAHGKPLQLTMRDLCLRIESFLPDVVCSIVCADGLGRLKSLAGPSLPRRYRKAIEGLTIGPETGACGAAIFLGRPVETWDIAIDPRWSGFAELPLSLGLKACWSTPILDRDGRAIGAFTLYFRETRAHSTAEAEIVRAATALCAVAMERDRQTAALHGLAYRDMLTGLPNRAAFQALTGKMGAGTATFGGLVLIDFDNLKTVNDTFGQEIGDRLVQGAVRRIEEAASPFQAFRLGGDEFAVVVGADQFPPGGLTALAETILAGLSEPIDCGDKPLEARATLGVAWDVEGAPLETLHQNADFALYHAKQTRRGSYVVFSDEIGASMTRRLSAIRDVDLALDEDRIDAFYQPVVRIDTGEVVGLEALFRVITPTGEVLPAGDYMEATTDAHTAGRLTRRIVDIVARDIRGWLDQGIWFQHVGVNASPADLQSGRLHGLIREAFDRHGVSLWHLILEITESVYMDAGEGGVGQTIQDLRAMGVRVALDDFGTGFASLSHLLSIPVDIIKIDRSFVSRMDEGERGGAIVEAILAMADKLGLRVVAEGVETPEQADQLRRWGCVLGQGYFYAKPADRRAITGLLIARAQRPDSDTRLAAAPGGNLLDIAIPRNETVVRYAILLCGGDWRVVSERRQFGRFPTRSTALQCALGLAREAIASGASVEILHADAAGELRAFKLPGPPQLAA